MTLFHTSIEKVIQGIEKSNYPFTPFTPFDYTDEFVEELHFRLPPPGLVELALYEQNINKAIDQKERVPLDKIICLEAVVVRKAYQNKGYMTALLNSLEANFQTVIYVLLMYIMKVLHTGLPKKINGKGHLIFTLF